MLREKNFILQKQQKTLDEVSQIEVELQRAAVAEKAYYKLKSEIDLIQDELNLEA